MEQVCLLFASSKDLVHLVQSQNTRLLGIILISLNKLALWKIGIKATFTVGTDMQTHKDGVSFLGGRFVVEFTSLNDLFVNIELVASPSQHRFLDTLLGYETINADDLGLSNSMGTILSLKICMGIPIAVISATTQTLCKLERTIYSQNNRVGRLQVQSQSTSSRGEQENIVGGTGGIKFAEQLSAILRFCTTIEAQELPVFEA
jgi:hypothetical protein